MSLRILIVPEDPSYNGAILAPLVTRMLTHSSPSLATRGRPVEDGTC